MIDEDAPAPFHVAENRRGLESLIFASTRLMEIASSVLVRSQAVDGKTALAREIWALAQAANLMRERFRTLRSSRVDFRPANRSYLELTNQIVSLQNPDSELAALVHLGYPDLRNAVLTHRARVPAAADEATIDCLTQVLDRFDVLRLAQRPVPYCLSPIEELLESAGGALGFGVPEDGAPDVGPQLDDFRDMAVLSALPIIPVRPGRESRLREALPGQKVNEGGYGPALHDFAFRIELCATEICAALLAHHPEAPWGLRFDLARQTRDEARHFELFIERVCQLGVAPGERPLQFEVWDKFTVGSTLPERLIIEQRIGEGAALDSAEEISRRLRADGEFNVALVFEYITADEVTHVANGNKWLRHLLGSDESIAKVEDDVRRRLASRGLPAVYKHPLNVEDRLLSGFTSAELARIRQVQADERGAKTS